MRKEEFIKNALKKIESLGTPAYYDEKQDVIYLKYVITTITIIDIANYCHETYIDFESEYFLILSANPYEQLQIYIYKRK